MRKFLIVWVMGLLWSFSGCIKIPKDYPDWKISIKLPAGDTSLTMRRVVDEDSRLVIIGDTVYWYEDTIIYDRVIPNTQIPFVSGKYGHSYPSEIDTQASSINSELTSAIYGVYIFGRIDTTAHGKLKITFYTNIDTLTDSTEINLAPGNYYNYLIQDVLHRIPLRSFTAVVRIDSISGGGYLDSVKVFYKMPMNIKYLGDTILTNLLEVEIPSTLMEDDTVKPDFVNSYLLHLKIWNLMPIELLLHIDLFTQDTQRQFVLIDSFHLPMPSLANGVTQGIPAFYSTTIEIPDTFFKNYLNHHDSVFVKTSVIVPPQPDTVFFLAEDSIRVWGYVEIIKHIKSEEEQ